MDWRAYLRKVLVLLHRKKAGESGLRWETKIYQEQLPMGGTRSLIALTEPDGKVTVYGGSMMPSPVDDTWTFDGSTWTHKT